MGPPGVLVVDTKNWTGGRLRLDDHGMAVGKWRKDDELHAAKVDADIVRAHVQALLPEAPVLGVIAFVQDMDLNEPTLHLQVLLAQRDQLLPALRRASAVLTAAQVALLGAHLQEQLPHRHPGARRATGAVAADSTTVDPTAEGAGEPATTRHSATADPGVNQRADVQGRPREDRGGRGAGRSEPLAR